MYSLYGSLILRHLQIPLAMVYLPPFPPDYMIALSLLLLLAAVTESPTQNGFNSEENVLSHM